MNFINSYEQLCYYTMNNGITEGKIVSFNFDERIDLKEFSLNDFFNEISVLTYRIIFNRIHSLDEDDSYYKILYAMFDIVRLEQTKDKFIEKIQSGSDLITSITFALKFSAKIYFNNNEMIFKKECLEYYFHLEVDSYLSRLDLFLKRKLLKEKMSFYKENIIWNVDVFDNKYLYEIPANIKGISAKEYFNSEVIDYKRILPYFDIVAIKCNLQRYNLDYAIISTKEGSITINPSTDELLRFKQNLLELGYIEPSMCTGDTSYISFFTHCVDEKKVSEITTQSVYKGVIFYPEFDFMNYGLVVDRVFMYKRYSEILTPILESGKTLFIRLPDFRQDKPVDYLDGIGLTYDLLYDDEIDVFNMFFEVIYDMFKNFDCPINIVVPNVDDFQNFVTWKKRVKYALGDYNGKKTKIGFCLEHESTYHEMYKYSKRLYKENADFAIIEIDDLIKSFKKSEDYFDYNNIIKDYRDIFKGIRDTFLPMKIEIMLSVPNVLFNKKTMSKFMALGYKKIIVPVSLTSVYHKTAEEKFDLLKAARALKERNNQQKK